MPAPHFAYDNAALRPYLQQGDILRKTSALDAILSEAHPYYSRKLDNKFFLVLTQSCDLIRRGGAPCSSRYITIAPIRPVRIAVNRLLERHRRAPLAAMPIVATSHARTQAKNFLERLLNNNESSYFFLREDPTREFPEDGCAFLALSIALKVDHYQACMDAKIIELTEIFQAKLGWLVGQMYSRVGTPDWDASALDQYVASYLEQASLWIPDRSVNAFAKLVKEWRQAHPGDEPTEDVLLNLVAKLPDKREMIMERLIAILEGEGAITEENRKRLANLLRNDPTLSALIPPG